MRLAYQSIIWGVRPRDFSSILGAVKRHGFSGIEIAQAPAYLPPPDVLRELLDANDLELLSLCGGSFDDRWAYCRDGGLKPLYYYTERIDKDTYAKAQSLGIRLALHPHVYTQLSQPDKIKEVLEAFPEVFVLPDAAHLYMAHVDAVEVLAAYYDRLASVHIKDWTSLYGRSCQRYALGFAELGQGEVHPERLLAYLRKRNYQGWVVLECDSTRLSIEQHLADTCDWLRAQAVSPSGDIEAKHARSAPRPSARPNEKLAGLAAKDVPSGGNTCFYRMMFKHLRQDSLETFAQTVLESLHALIPNTIYAQAWEHSPTNGLLGLLAEYPSSRVEEGQFILKIGDNIQSRTVQSMAVTRVDVSSARDMFNVDVGPECASVIAVPVFNSCNPNYVEMVLCFFVGATDKRITDDQLLDYAEYVGIAYETVLDELCITTSSAIVQKLAGVSWFNMFVDTAIAEIKVLMKCQGATLFLVETAGRRLKCSATTGIQWKVDLANRFYDESDLSPVSKVWATNEAIVVYDRDPIVEPKSEETVPNSREHVTLTFPVRDLKGEVIGVLRCRNRTEGRQMFSESDMALVEALCQAIVPNLLVLQESTRRTRTIDRMVHEIKMPLTAIRGAIDVLEQESKRQHIKFAHDYTGDVSGWLDLMKQVLFQVDFYRYKISGRFEALRPHRTKTMLLRDVFAPATRHTRFLLRERNFSPDRIAHDDFYHVPLLYLDKAMFQQVFFNLLGNAIKYCYSDPDSFNISVRTARDDYNYLIFFQDWGLGIPVGYENVIFDPYVRGPGMEEYNVSGDGLGLWVVRQIVEAHGGTIVVKSLSQPTEFMISLPKALSLENSNL